MPPTSKGWTCWSFRSLPLPVGVCAVGFVWPQPRRLRSRGDHGEVQALTTLSAGYNFKSLQQISPFLEHAGSGITSLWARTTALKHDCTVVVGYPEKVDVSPKWPTSPEYYNSALVVNGEGDTIANYRKSFLYFTDETWALEGGEGFFQDTIPGLGNVALGICTDLKYALFSLVPVSINLGR